MTKRRHHYIPQFYLKNFIDPKDSPYICIYDKEGNDIIKATAKDIAVEKHYFTFITPDGKKDSETLENAMAQLEGVASAVIEKIIQEKLLDEKDKAHFSSFISCMLTRVPNFRNNIQGATEQLIKKISIRLASYKQGFEGMIRRFENDTGKKIGMPTEELRQWMLNGKKYDIKIEPQFSLALAMSNAVELTPLFNDMKWTFIKATPDYKFLTGDNPLYYSDPTHDRRSFYGVGLANKNIEVTFPISQDCCAFGSWHGKEGYLQGTNQLVKGLNQRTVIASLRFIFASEKSEVLNSFVKKYKNSSPKLRVG